MSGNILVSIHVANVLLNENVDFVGGPQILVGIDNSGEQFPLFAFNENEMNYDPVKFIGMNVEEVIEEKRILDLIWFGTIRD